MGSTMRSGGLLVEEGGRAGRAGRAAGDLPSQAPRHTADLMAGVKGASEERNRHCGKDSGQCTQTHERCLELNCDQEC